MTKRKATDLTLLIELLKDLKAEVRTLGLPNSLSSNVSEMRKTISAVEKERKKRNKNAS
jgi:hypothetical protein